ncbi:hypothetical protein [Hymenobacter sp. GOD-10R]|nr:hypothetical protein [Hymenobacter sp. GOD-10R]WRQ27641.1 hypothetical protein SD425_21455 [Hymenobacter sp. GOD-10R]
MPFDDQVAALLEMHLLRRGKLQSEVILLNPLREQEAGVTHVVFL